MLIDVKKSNKIKTTSAFDKEKAVSHTNTFRNNDSSFHKRPYDGSSNQQRK